LARSRSRSPESTDFSMTIGVTRGRLIAVACVMLIFASAFAGAAVAAPHAADLGPEVPLAQPAGGFVGRLSVTPAHGPVGTSLTVTGEALPPAQECQLVWR